MARDCPKACDNANIAQESEQKGKSESMLDLDSTSVSEECVMVCTELMSKIKCFNCGEYGNFARDCLKACDNANIAQESEQKGKSESMLDLDSTSVSEECATVCTELQYEDASENEVVYSDQGISTEEYEKATYAIL